VSGIRVDKSKKLLDLRGLEATRVNSSVRREIVAAGASLLDIRGTLWVADPHFVIATVFGSVTAFGEAMKNHIVDVRDDEYGEVADLYYKYVKSWNPPHDIDDLAGQLDSLERARDRAEGMRVRVKAVEGRSGYGLKYTKTGATRALAARWLRKQATSAGTKRRS
jgi:hypothetical protein